MDPDKGKDQDPEKVTPCVGAGIYRTHINRDPRLANDKCPHYPANKELVFSDPVEFLMHHAGMIKECAQKETSPMRMRLYIEAEFRRAQGKLIAVDRVTGKVLELGRDMSEELLKSFQNGQ